MFYLLVKIIKKKTTKYFSCIEFLGTHHWKNGCHNENDERAYAIDKLHTTPTLHRISLVIHKKLLELRTLSSTTMAVFIFHLTIWSMVLDTLSIKAIHSLKEYNLIVNYNLFNWRLQPFNRDYNLASHTCGVCLFYSWVTKPAI